MPEIEQFSEATASESCLFGKYELGKLLGCGAFAKVYHARDIRNGQSVAVKVINKKRIANPTLMTNVKREISIMRRLSHPHIVKLFEVLATKTKIYFIMEFVKGGELFSKISKLGRFNEDLSRKYFQQLISAVRYCHSRGVYHRDLKPENILVDENGDLKVSDFGLSALTDQVQQNGLLYTFCGTPAYVAPEILTKKGYDGKVDIWSCGIILFVLNAGYLPFNDPNLMAMYKKIYKGEFRCPKWMSTDLKRFLSRLLDTNPMKRISIDEIIKDPWFRKSLKRIKFFHEDIANEAKEHLENDDDIKKTSMNAFDLISFSSGLNLSGLFNESGNPMENSEKAVVEGIPEKIMERVEEELAKENNIKVKRKKEWGMEIKVQNGKFTMSLDVYSLTDRLTVVEVERTDGDGALYRELWRNKIKPVVLGQVPVSGS